MANVPDETTLENMRACFYEYAHRRNRNKIKPPPPAPAKKTANLVSSAANMKEPNYFMCVMLCLVLIGLPHRVNDPMKKFYITEAMVLFGPTFLLFLRQGQTTGYLYLFLFAIVNGDVVNIIATLDIIIWVCLWVLAFLFY